MTESYDVEAHRGRSPVQSTGTTLDDRELRASGAGPPTAPPAESEVFAVLKNSRRRHILRFLIDEQRRVSLAELAVHIAACENDIPTGAVTSAQRKRVYVSLYQSHLPKLDDVGAVDYNDARKYAQAADHLDVFRPYLEEEADDPVWSQWYLTLGLVGLVGLIGSLGTTLGGGGGPVVLREALLVVLTTAFLVLACYHAYWLSWTR